MTLMESARRYARNGWAVFPVHGVQNGLCTCGNSNCGSPGKHPIHTGGFKNATTDLEMIDGWWSQNPAANIGIATGTVSGLFVVDVDCGPGKTGFASLGMLEEKFGALPKSAVVRTGSGGLHIYLSMPSGALKSSAGKLAPAIDIRADGGYVVAPPSTHISGNQYQWEQPNA